MSEALLIEDLGWIVAAAAAFAIVGRWIGLPGIVAYLLAGLAIGPLTGVVTMTPGLELLSEVGITLLLFVVGLELSFGKIRAMGRVAVLAGGFQIALTFAGGLALGLCLGLEAPSAALLGAGLAFSSTVVAVKMLDERDAFNRLHGRLSVGVLLVQDLVAIILLTVLAGLSRSTGEASVVEPAGLAAGMGRAMIGMALLLAGSLAAARWILPRPFAWLARRPEALLVWSLAWCFALVLAAHALHLSLEIGAFLAGVSLAQLPYNEDLHRRVHPIMDFAIAVFFVCLGLKMNLTGSAVPWASAVAISLFVLLGKPALFLWILPRLGYGVRTSLLTGLTLSQISEFSFIVAALGVSTGLVGPEFLSLISVVGLLTITGSAFLVRFGDPLVRLAARSGLLKPFLPAALQRHPAPGAEDSTPATTLAGHIIVVGMNSLGRRLATALAEAGETVVAIDTDPHKLAGLPCRREIGNVTYRAVLGHAGLPRAKLLVSALRIDAVNELLAFRCAQAGVRCAMHVHDLREMDHLLQADTSFLILSKVDGVKELHRQLAALGLCPPARA